MIIKMTGFEGKLIWQTDKPNGQPRRGLDVSRARELFGWSAKVPFEEGMRRTIEWFKENREELNSVSWSPEFKAICMDKVIASSQQTSTQ